MRPARAGIADAADADGSDEGGARVEPSIGKAEFALMARRSGVPLSDDDIDTLYEGYGWFERLVLDLDRPADARAAPALVFTPQIEP